MFGDLYPARRDNERDRGGDVEGVGAVATGTDDIEDDIATGLVVQYRLHGPAPQLAGKRRNLDGGLAFPGQGREEIGFSRHRDGFVNQLLDREADLLVRQRVGCGALASEFVEHWGSVERWPGGGN